MEIAKLPYNQRLCISIDEAAAYSMIGENRLRSIIENDQYKKELDWVLYVGQHKRIKRPLFEKWVLKQTYL